jgi:hypothetical protein
MLKTIFLILGIVIILGTIFGLVTGIAGGFPVLCMFIMPLIYVNWGDEMAVFFGVNDDLLNQLCMLVFGGSGLLYFLGMELISMLLTSAGLIELGLIISGLVPESMMEKATSILSAPVLISFVPLFLIIGILISILDREDW